MNSENSNRVINIILIGSTGSGKSTTGNTLYGEALDRPFTVGDEAVSCTYLADQHVNHSKGLRLIDTPGFGDNRFHEKQIDKIIRDLTITLTDPRVESSGVIDAFLLPVKFYPRPATLKPDLEHFMDIFGTVALKSLIILPIYMDNKKRTEENAWNDFSKMTEIMNMLGEGKGRVMDNNWICLWDNLNHKPNQEENLLAKIKNVESYTHQKFVEAAQEIQKRLDAKVQEEVNRLVNLARKDFADDKEMMEKKIQEIQLRAQQERSELLAAQDRAQNETTRFLEAMQQMNEGNRAELAKLYEQMSLEREKSNEQLRKLTEDMNTNHNRQIQEIMKANSQQMAAMQSQILQLSNQRPQMVERVVHSGGGGSRGGCNMF